MRFGRMTDNGIEKNPLNFGQDPDHDSEEMLSVSRAYLVEDVVVTITSIALHYAPTPAAYASTSTNEKRENDL